MVNLQIEHQGLSLLLRLLPREIADIERRVEWAIECGDETEGSRLAAEENTCKRLLYACQHCVRDTSRATTRRR